jgi:hypothetical protein
MLWLAVPVTEVWRRKSAGAVLLDLGGCDRRLFECACGGLIVAGCLTGILFSAAEMLFPFLAFLSMGVAFIASGTRRFQLRETGILRPGRLIPWDKIEGYELSSIGTLSLKMKGKRLTFCCDVPSPLRVVAEELLASRVPGPCGVPRREMRLSPLGLP